jgi:glycosyltransferase involved in cell wall biosynthesis
MMLSEARIALQQRVLPEYRVAFFNALGEACQGRLEVFAGLPRRNEAITTGEQLTSARFIRARNMHLFSGKTYFCIQYGFLHWLEQFQPHLLIVEANPRYLSTPAAIQWMHHHHRPVIGWGLGAPKAGNTEKLLRKKFLDSLDGIIAYSQAGARQYIDAGMKPERVFIAPNAVAPRPQHQPAFRAAEFRDGKASLLFVGRLQERKRLDILLQACARLPSHLQPRLTIIGDGPDRSRLEALAHSVYPAAQFTGARHGDQLEPFFDQVDLFVLPGTGGLAVQQAMAHGLPVIVGKADGTQVELVKPENGWLLPGATVENLTATLKSAIGDVGRLREMGKASFRIVDEEVNLEVMVQGFVNAIQTILKG